MNIVSKINMNEYRAVAHKDICKLPQTTTMIAREKAKTNTSEEMQ